MSYTGAPPQQILGAANIPGLGKFIVNLSCGHQVVCDTSLDSPEELKELVCPKGCPVAPARDNA